MRAAIWMVPAVWAGLAVILWVMTWLERRLITQPPVDAELVPPAASETRFTDARPVRSRLGAIGSPPNPAPATDRPAVDGLGRLE